MWLTVIKLLSTSIHHFLKAKIQDNVKKQPKMWGIFVMDNTEYARQQISHQLPHPKVVNQR